MLTIEEDRDLFERLSTIDTGRLRGWPYDFITDVRSRYEEHGAEMFVSGRMWFHINKIWSSQND